MPDHKHVLSSCNSFYVIVTHCSRDVIGRKHDVASLHPLCGHHSRFLLDALYTNRLEIAIESLVWVVVLPATDRSNLYTTIYIQASHRYVCSGGRHVFGPNRPR